MKASYENHPDYLVYKEMENEYKTYLEYIYNSNILNKNIVEAYKVLGSLMRYKLISKDDYRLSNVDKVFKKEIDKSHRFKKDYRTDITYIPDWLVADLEQWYEIYINTLPHWGLRVEGVYEADQYFNSITHTITINECNTYKTVYNGFEGIIKLLKDDTNNMIDYKILGDLCAKGIYRIYSLWIESQSIYTYKDLGYVVLRYIKPKCIEYNVILNYESLLNNWIGIKKFEQELISKLKLISHEHEAKINVVINNSKYLDKQKAMSEKSRNTGLMHAKLRKESNK